MSTAASCAGDWFLGLHRPRRSCRISLTAGRRDPATPRRAEPSRGRPPLGRLHLGGKRLRAVAIWWHDRDDRFVAFAIAALTPGREAKAIVSLLRSRGRI